MVDFTKRLLPRNSLPRLLTNGDDEYAGMPTVKVETVESVSILGLITDSETPLSMLTITSESPEFIGWIHQHFRYWLSLVRLFEIVTAVLYHRVFML